MVFYFFDAREQPLKSFRPTRRPHPTYTALHMSTHSCAICAYPSSTKCGGCKKVFYCSREHQVIVTRLWPSSPFYEIKLTSNLGVEETQRSLQNLSNG